MITNSLSGTAGVNSGKHPVIVSFGETQQGKFPLILVIGREPNSTGEVGDFVQSFGFNHDPHCPFWNRSRRQLARRGGGEVAAQKITQFCKEKNACPIVYADSLGICIPNKVQNKTIRRKEWVDVPMNVPIHVHNIFSHEEIIHRVLLVIMSGVDDPIFELAVGLIKQKCEIRPVRIPYVHVPFFSARFSNAKLDGPLKDEDEHAEILHQIYDQFTQFKSS